MIREAIFASGINPESVAVKWEPNLVRFDDFVEIQPAMFDCRNLLNTPCWIVSCAVKPDQARACSCGSLVREARTGVYGSLKTAVASAMAEIARARVLTTIPDTSDTILNARPDEVAPQTCNDFIAHCAHTQ